MAQDYELSFLSYITPRNFFKDRKKRKDRITRLNMNNMFRRTIRMFKWEGLPDTIPERELELLVQSRGLCGIIEVKGNLYALWGTLGGVPNWNYMPSQFICSNPYLNLNANTYEIYGDKKNVVILANDSLYQGLTDLISFHSEILTEIELTKRAVLINNRMPTALTAPDNNTKKDIDDFFKDLEEGELASIFDRNFLNNINAIDMSNGAARNLMTQLLEAQQYQKAALFNDIGLQLNYNMKRETITSSEAQLGEGALLPLCDDMLEMRKLACEQWNELYGTNVRVEFSSAWENLRESIETELEAEQNEADMQPSSQMDVPQEEEKKEDGEDDGKSEAS